MKVKRLSHDIIIRALVDALKPLDCIHAFWEAGAIAFNRVDEWSDIDVYLVVDDDKVEKAFLDVERALRSLSPIKQKYDVPQSPYPGVAQAFYRLRDASEYLIIDLAIMKLSTKDKFLEPEIHGNAVFYFNKSGAVRCPPLDRGALVSRLHARLDRLQARFDMFNNFVQKEINRGNYLEAIDLYSMLTLATVVEALRIKHNPFHYDFKMRYIHYELPSKVLERLQHLYFVRDEKDLKEKYNEAAKWFKEIMSDIDKKEINKLVKNFRITPVDQTDSLFSKR